MKRVLVRIFLIAAVVSAAAAALFFVLTLGPGFESIPDDAPTVVAGDRRIDGTRIGAFTARYRTGSQVMGVPVSGREVTIEVDKSADELHWAFFNEGQPVALDRIVLDGTTLEPKARELGSQTYVYRGSVIDVEVRSADAAPDTLHFEFPHAVFEVSVLEWILVALGESDLAPTRLAWNNFPAPSADEVEVRQIGRETVAGPQGESFDTRVVDLRFASGEIRRFWVAMRPPYKIRQRRYDRGRALTSSWDLLEYKASP